MNWKFDLRSMWYFKRMHPIFNALLGWRNSVWGRIETLKIQSKSIEYVSVAFDRVTRLLEMQQSLLYVCNVFVNSSSYFVIWQEFKEWNIHTRRWLDLTVYILRIWGYIIHLFIHTNWFFLQDALIIMYIFFLLLHSNRIFVVALTNTYT